MHSTVENFTKTNSHPKKIVKEERKSSHSENTLTAGMLYTCAIKALTIIRLSGDSNLWDCIGHANCFVAFLSLVFHMAYFCRFRSRSVRQNILIALIMILFSFCKIAFECTFKKISGQRNSPRPRPIIFSLRQLLAIVMMSKLISELSLASSKKCDEQNVSS